MPSIPLEFFFSKMSNAELLHVLEYPGQYQSEALSIATSELEKRSITAAEIQANKLILQQKEAAQKKQATQRKAVEEKIKTKGNNLLDFIHPIQKETATIEKSIQLIVIVFSVLLAFRLYNLVRFYFFGYFSVSVNLWLLLASIAENLILGIGLWLCWNRKKTGWITLAFYMGFNTISTLLMLAQSIQLKMRIGFSVEVPWEQYALIKYVVSLILYIATIYFLAKKQTREYFYIDARTAIFSFVGGVLISLVLFVSL